jgi:hypothetical protein
MDDGAKVVKSGRHIPWPDTVAISVKSYMRGQDECGHVMCRTIMRLNNMSSFVSKWRSLEVVQESRNVL